MKQIKLSGILAGASLLCMSGLASGAVIDISLNASDWELDGDRDPSWQAPSTKSNTAEGLQVTINTSNPGSPRGAYYWSKDTFNVQDSVLRYKWKAIPGNNSYANYWNGLDTWTFGAQMTTSWSWAGSTVIDNDRWIYTELSVQDDLSYYYNFSYDGYGDSGGFRWASGSMSQALYDSLASVHLRFSTNDNRTVGAGFVIGEAQLITQNPVPIPAAVWLFGSGLVGLVGLTRRKKAMASA